MVNSTGRRRQGAIGRVEREAILGTKQTSAIILFGVKFVVLFAIFWGAFEASRGTAVERILVEDAILKPTVELIRMAAPGEAVYLSGRSIVSPNSKLNVTRGCEGVEIFLILAAGVLAFPAGWRARLQGLAVGFVLAYALSVTRLIALHFTLRHAPAAWEALHGLVLPLGPIIVIALYFLHWSGGIATPAQKTSHAT
jgi:exosortase family protein XrtM